MSEIEEDENNEIVKLLRTGHERLITDTPICSTYIFGDNIYYIYATDSDNPEIKNETT